MSPATEIQILAAVVAVACALPGVFLILRRMALMSDAISHAILFGIVIGFLVVKDLASPVILIAAAATGVLTVTLTELLRRTGRVAEDTSIGLVFPVLFSIGVILISQKAGDVHLDTDAVLLGEIAFAPLDRLEWAGRDLGPRSLWVVGIIGVINLIFILLFYKELKLTSFDPALAASLGFSPIVMHYALMSLTSITAVGAFDAVGSILVVALMVAPPATAYLLTDRLSVMIWLSCAIAIVGAVAGYWLARWLDASVAGCMATMAGALFGLGFLCAPRRGLLALAARRAKQKTSFAVTALTIHLSQHEGTEREVVECRRDHLGEHLGWDKPFADRVLQTAIRTGAVELDNGLMQLTDRGRALARTAFAR
ncbi:MAG: iron chelate uptake ABC transporter family permease subunit [Armatimonadia bacterium]|nr:iron chelate uptake ABC transporter family permease subunit [Armatimonadia bacterium]